MKKRLALVVFAGLASLFLVLLLPSGALAATSEAWVTAQITSNGLDEGGPCVSGDRIVWERYDGADWEIYTWTPASGIVQLTSNTREDTGARVSGNLVVWYGYDGHDYEIYSWTPATGTVQLTSNTWRDSAPDVSGDRVTWRADGSSSSYTDVYTWTLEGGIVRLTTDEGCYEGPFVSGGRIEWSGSIDEQSAIWTWTAGSGIVNAGEWGEWASISGDRIAWNCAPGGGNNSFSETFTWTPGGGAVRLTTNEFVDNFTSVSGDRIAWNGGPTGESDWEVYTWTPVDGVVRLTTNTSGDIEPQVSGDRIAWMNYTGGTTTDEIVVWSPASGAVKLTSNSVADVGPDIDGARVVWMHDDGTDYEICTAVAYPVTIPEITSIEPAAAPTTGAATVVINGSGFLSLSGAAAVKFGGTNATSYTVNSPTKITAVAPAHAAGKVDVTVTAVGGASATAGAADDFVYLARYEQADTHFAYSGTWTVSSSSSASGGSFRFCNATGSVTVSFTGTHLAWIAKTSPVYGKAKVTLDDTAPVTVDLYSAAALYKRPVWNTGTLESGTHTVKIEWTGTKNGSATDTNVSVDAFDIQGTLSQAVSLTRYQETAAALVYSGGPWSTSTVASASGGTFKYANSDEATVIVPFTGTYLSWIVKKSPVYGIAKVSVDGGAPTNVDLYNSATLYQQTAWSSGKLASGLHWVKILWAGLGSGSPTGTNVSIDAVDVMGSLTAATRYEQTSSKLVWAGTWTTSTTTSASGSSFKFADKSGASATVKFTGISCNLIAKKSPVYGIAEVKLDDQAAVLVDFYSASALFKQTVWRSGFLAPGDHTVTIKWNGTKRTAATDYNIGIDAVDVIGSLR
jgi:beta propeller repeat protein